MAWKYSLFISLISLSSFSTASLTCFAEGFFATPSAAFFPELPEVSDVRAAAVCLPAAFSSLRPYISIASLLISSVGELINGAASRSAFRTTDCTFSVGFSIYRIFIGSFLTAASCTVSDGADTYLMFSPLACTAASRTLSSGCLICRKISGFLWTAICCTFSVGSAI